MDGIFLVVWDLLTSAGSALALTLVVALALGIGGLTLFFFGSSVVVLQGFARRARLGVPLLAIVGVEALGLAALLGSQEELRGFLPAETDRTLLWAQWSAGAAAVSVVLVAVSAFVLRRLSAGGLARSSLVLLALGYALVVGGTGRLAYAAAPALVCLAVAAVVALRRRSRGAARGDVEPAFWILGGVLGLGLVLAASLGGPSPAWAVAGEFVLQAFVLLVVLGLVPLAVAGFLEMRGSPEWFIASRYLVAQRRQTFISIISVICAAGVAAGVWLIITVLSVMNGFQQVWREEFVGKRAHLTVMSRYGNFSDYRDALDSVLATDEVVGASPFLDAEGMVRSDHGQIQGVRIRGIDPELIKHVSTLSEDVVAGSLADIAVEAPPADGPPEDLLPGIALASGLAWRFGLAVGDPILVVSPFGGPPTPFGPAPRLHRYRVAAIFQPSFAQLDEFFTYVSLVSAQNFLRVSDVVQGIEVRTEDFYRSNPVGTAIQMQLGGDYYVRDWKEVFPEFFQALKTERVMMFILLTMIMVVASFVIVATLIMKIMEKTSDIAILKAMGAEDEVIERIFAIEGTLIGLAGTAVGVVAGLLVTKRLSWVQQQVESLTGIDTLPPSVYQGVSTLPSNIDPVQVAGVAAIAMVLALGATLLPSRHGARLDPAESLRYE
jgi:lipoprotein-releasing system permease protein